MTIDSQDQKIGEEGNLILGVISATHAGKENLKHVQTREMAAKYNLLLRKAEKRSIIAWIVRNGSTKKGKMSKLYSRTVFSRYVHIALIKKVYDPTFLNKVPFYMHFCARD